MKSHEQFAIVPSKLLLREDLTTYEKLLLTSLLLYADDNGEAYPSQAKLGQCMSASRKCVRETLRKLESKKTLEITHSRGRNNSRYKLKIDTQQEPTFPVEQEPTFPVEPQIAPQQEPTFPSQGSHVPPNKPLTNKTLEPKTKTTRARAREENSLLKIEQSALLIVEEKKITKNAQEKIYEADYEHFYRAYPKPKNPDKTPGRKKYVALRQKGVSAEDLLKAAENYATANRTTPPQYIKRIATFLGPQEAWKDFVALECETEKQRALSGEEEYMRDALGVGLISQNEYDEWRRKFYGVR